MIGHMAARSFRAGGRFAHIATIVGLAAAAVLSGAAPAAADHSWGGYHWARTAAPFTLQLGDNVNSTWDSYLATTSTDWTSSAALNTTIVPGQSNPKRCNAVAGTVQVCNSTYGQNGWLGIASVWASGAHITQGTVKLNDTYFRTAKYNTPAWKNMVTCQEVGHALGLGHVDEAFDNPNQGTCMDYTNNPTGPPNNEHPNQHDYDLLDLTIYAHLDSSSTVAASAAQTRSVDPGDTPASWGRAVAFTKDGRGRVYVRDLGNNQRITTFVSWAPDAPNAGLKPEGH